MASLYIPLRFAVSIGVFPFQSIRHVYNPSPEGVRFGPWVIRTQCSSVEFENITFSLFSRECQFYHSYHSFISQENHSNSNAQMHTQRARKLNSHLALEHRYIKKLRISPVRFVVSFIAAIGTCRSSIYGVASRQCVREYQFTQRRSRYCNKLLLDRCTIDILVKS